MITHRCRRRRARRRPVRRPAGDAGRPAPGRGPGADGRRRAVPHRPRGAGRRDPVQAARDPRATRAPAWCVEVGSAVTRVAPGDHVLLSFTSCGRCANCRDGHPAYCDTWVPEQPHRRRPRRRQPGGAAQRGGHRRALLRPVLVRRPRHRRRAQRGQASTPARRWRPWRRSAARCRPDSATVWNILAPEPGTTLAVFGSGAVGLAAVMAANLLPMSAIVAIDRVPDRLALAAELGATHTVNTRDRQRRHRAARHHRRPGRELRHRHHRRAGAWCAPPPTR